jgi:high-affinity iron transporter
MLAAAIIVFREVIEAGLIVGIVLAATRGVRARAWYVMGGIGAGLIGAAILAAFAGALSGALEGVGQEVFSASILGVAVVMLGWHNVWMAQHGRELAVELTAAGQAVVAGAKTLTALAIVVGVAVLREGVEVVLFLYGVVIANGDSALSLFTGGMLGLAAGAALSALTYAGLVKIPSRYLFTVTSYLIAFLAAGMASQCVHFLDQADIVSALSATAWDTSWILSSGSIVGRIFHTLLGYDDRPSIMQALVYLATLFTILIAMRVFAPAKTQPKPKLAGEPAPAKTRVAA